MFFWFFVAPIPYATTTFVEPKETSTELMMYPARWMVMTTIMLTAGLVGKIYERTFFTSINNQSENLIEVTCNIISILWLKIPKDPGKHACDVIIKKLKQVINLHTCTIDKTTMERSNMAYILKAIASAGRSAGNINWDTDCIEIFMDSCVTGGCTFEKDDYVPGTFKSCDPTPMLGSGGSVEIKGYGLAHYDILDDNGEAYTLYVPEQPYVPNS